MGDLLLLGFLYVRLRVLALEDDGQSGDGLPLPPGHQVLVKLMLGSELGGGSGFVGRFQDDPGRKRRNVVSSWALLSASV